MNNIEEDLLDCPHPILRKLLSSEEIKVANRLVKEGKLMKGISDDKQKSRTYYNPQI
jgi:hypothetical protein